MCLALVECCVIWGVVLKPRMALRLSGLHIRAGNLA